MLVYLSTRVRAMLRSEGTTPQKFILVPILYIIFQISQLKF
jgi:hypothetical protein